MFSPESEECNRLNAILTFCPRLDDWLAVWPLGSALGVALVGWNLAPVGEMLYIDRAASDAPQLNRALIRS